MLDLNTALCPLPLGPPSLQTFSGIPHVRNQESNDPQATFFLTWLKLELKSNKSQNHKKTLICSQEKDL